MTQGELAAGTLKREAAGWGRELKQAGVNLDLAPVMDVVPPGTDELLVCAPLRCGKFHGRSV